MKKLLLLLFLTPVALIETACGNSEEKFKLAILETELVGDQLSKEAKAIVVEIEKGLGTGVEVVNVANTDAAKTAAVSGQVDMVWTSAATFWEAEAEKKDLDIIATIAKDGKMDNAGYWAEVGVHTDNAASYTNCKMSCTSDEQNQNLNKLKDKSFSFVSKTSTSGGLLPREMFWSATTVNDYKHKDDIYENNKFLSKIVLSSTHTQSIMAILDKAAHAGAYYEPGLSAAIESPANDKNHKLSDMVTIAKAQAPGDPLWGNIKSLGQDKVDALTKHLVSIDSINAKDLYQDDAIHFTDSSIKWVKTDKTHSSYTTLRDLHNNMDRT